MRDGHSSRLNADVLRWCRENEWIMYISPPHTTGIHQALDQIFKSWHDTFNGVVKRWYDENTGTELNKRIFTDIFAEAWQHWTTADKIVAAFRRVGLSVKGVDPSAVPEAKFIVAQTVAKPPPALPPPPTVAALPPPQTPAPNGPQLRSAGAGSSTDALTPAQPAAPAIDWSLQQWESPSPEAGLYAPDSREYWMAKQKLTSAHARCLFAAGKTMHETPLTLKESHPAWQVKRTVHTSESNEGGSKRVKGEWGDMDSVQMLERLEEQAMEEEAEREAIAQRKQERAERKEERDAADAAARAAREAALVIERPVTELLKTLGFVPVQKDGIAAGELAAFARANRAELTSLGIDLTALTKKALMPQLTNMFSTPFNVVWKKAPPKPLPAPAEPAPAPALAALVAPVDEAAAAEQPERAGPSGDADEAARDV